jgi:hypothetical protein
MEFVCARHRGIDRPCVRDVETEAGSRQLREHCGQFVGSAAVRLPVVHVLEDEAVRELPVGREGIDGIRMSHDRADPKRKRGASRAGRSFPLPPFTGAWTPT